MSNASDFIIENGVLKKYVGPGGDVVIPKDVTSIDGWALSGCTNLTSIVLPDGVTSIGAYAFHGCTNLTSIVLPDGVTSIGAGAFYGCTNLTSITLPASVTSIGTYAFYKCSALEELSISATDLMIEVEAFGCCKSLKKVSLAGGTIRVAADAFCDTPIRSIDISVDKLKAARLAIDEKTITELVKKGAAHPALIDSKRMPGAIPYLAKVWSKKSGEIANKGPWIKYLKHQIRTMLPIAQKSDAFLQMVVAEKILPLDCAVQWLEELNGKVSADAIAALLRYIDANTSPNKKKRNDTFDLKEPTITEMKKIWSFEKLDDNSLCITSYKGNDQHIQIPAMIGGAPVTELKGTFSIEVKGDVSVRRNIKTILVPETVKRIGAKTFYGCGKLEEVNIPVGVSVIEGSAFYGCHSLKEIELPGSVTRIEELAFANMVSLSKITIPDGTFIGERAFASNKALSCIHGSLEIRQISENAFAGCDLLTDQNGLFQIKDRLFWVRSDIENVIVPEEVSCFDKGILCGRRSILFSKAAEQTLTLEDMQVISGCGHLVFPEHITQIPDAEKGSSDYYGIYYKGFFSKNQRINEVAFPEGFAAIGSFAFYKCENLHTVRLPSTLCLLRQYAFTRTALQEVTIPGSVKIIECSVFEGCKSMTKATLLQGVESIQSEAFARCSALAEIHLPSSVTDIGEDVFTSKRILRIYAPAGSYAETYAKENNIPFVAE